MTYPQRLEEVHDDYTALEFDTINALGGIETYAEAVEYLKQRKKEAFLSGYIDSFYLIDHDFALPSDESVESLAYETGNGVPIDEILLDPDSDYSESFRSDAELVFRTEIHKSFVDGQRYAGEVIEEELKDTELRLVKVWDATLDEKTRDTHFILHGTELPLDGWFETYRGRSQAPGEFGIPEEDCNCRCMLAFRIR